MDLINWNPFGQLDGFLNPYDRSNLSDETALNNNWKPSVDITESDKEFVIKAELPEVKKEDVKVKVDSGIISINGERKSEIKDEKEHRVERFYGSFYRSFSLPENVKEKDIRAESKNGMLYLHLPKTTETKQKSIEIKVK